MQKFRMLVNMFEAMYAEEGIGRQHGRNAGRYPPADHRD